MGETAGFSAEGLSWNAAIGLARPLRDSSNLALYRITVNVGSEDGEERYVTLETLRIGNAP